MTGSDEPVAAPLRVAILLFDGCDLLDAGGPYDVLLTADRLVVRTGEPPRFRTVTLSRSGEPVTAYGGLRLTPHHAIDAVDDLDVLIVPGTVDLEAALGDQDLIDDVSTLAGRARLHTSVCTGAFLLAAAGLLDGRPATTHHEDLTALGDRDDVGEAVAGVRFVDDGDLVTAAGLSSGLSLGLHLVDRLAGRALAMATARQLEHAWDPDGGDAIP
jgi:transcriptional regulator GlxA family with amidase domain